MGRLARLLAIALCVAVPAAPAAAASLKLGGHGGLLGTGLLSGGSDTSGGGLSVTVGGGNGVAVGAGVSTGGGSGVDNDLFGNSNDNVLLDLFGNGGDAGDAQVNLGVSGLGGDSGAAGSGTSVTLDLFGDPNEATPVASPVAPVSGVANVTGGAVVEAPAGAPCFNPNAAQLARLANRHSYAPPTFQTWTGAAVVKVIDASVCAAAASRLGADPNIGRLRSYISTTPALRDGLTQWGHSAGEVIAVDRQGRTLIFYVG